jgi:hypothetical protein
MGWFSSPKCSVDEESKKWLESLFCWLLEEFGENVVKNTLVVLPDDEFFPHKFSAKREDIKILFDTVCEYMETVGDNFELYFYEDEHQKLRHRTPFWDVSGSEAAGLYHEIGENKYVVGLKLEQDINPENLIATMAHEIAHARLLGEKRISHEDENNEYLADLTTVIFGMGIFNANSAFNFSQYTDTKTQGWQASRQGYLSEEAFGYALAMFAYVRNEKSPSWAKFLKVGVKHHFTNSLKFLFKTKDTALKQLI